MRPETFIAFVSMLNVVKGELKQIKSMSKDSAETTQSKTCEQVHININEYW